MLLSILLNDTKCIPLQGQLHHASVLACTTSPIHHTQQFLFVGKHAEPIHTITIPCKRGQARSDRLDHIPSPAELRRQPQSTQTPTSCYTQDLGEMKRNFGWSGYWI